jgi:transposase InsO family protein
MDKIISKLYEENYYPNLNELYQILKDNNISVTKKQVKDFLDKQRVEQITKETKKRKKESGHIVAFSKNQLWQLDIFILKKYKKDNKGYSYLLCAVDVFTRKAYAEAMKHKNNDNVLEAIKKILDNANEVPMSIMSDSDSTFTSNKFQELLNSKNIVHRTVPIGDHAALGIIDRFARTLKKRLTKVIENKNDWINHYKGIINQYNNRPQESIGNIKPNEATEPDNVATIAELNNNKSKNNIIKNDLEIGDKVRVDTRKIFSKGTEPIYSDEVFVIKSINGKSILLNNNKIKKSNMLLKIDKNTPLGITKISKIKKSTKENKNTQQYKRENTDVKNIIYTKRKSKKKIITDL